MRTAIDAAGRLVIPKCVREEAGLHPGTELDVRVVEGVVEIEPAVRSARMVWKDGFLLAERLESGPVLTEEQVRSTIASGVSVACLGVGARGLEAGSRVRRERPCELCSTRAAWWRSR